MPLLLHLKTDTHKCSEGFISPIITLTASLKVTISPTIGSACIFLSLEKYIYHHPSLFSLLMARVFLSTVPTASFFFFFKYFFIIKLCTPFKKNKRKKFE